MRDASKGKRSKAGEESKKRLALYGISWDKLLPSGLSVPPGTKLRLSTDRGRRKDTGYSYLTPKTIDDVKRWIGVADEVAARKPCASLCPSNVTIVKSVSDLRNLSAAEMRGMYALGREYVHGDSRRLSVYRPILDALLIDAVIIGVFLREDIDVYSGSVLEIGSDVRVLWARNIRIWHGGTIRIEGEVKIDCVSIQGGLRSAAPANLARYRAPIGLLTALEVKNA